MSRKKALLQIHLAVLLAGFTGPLGRLISLREGVLVWYRMGISALTLGILLITRRGLRPVPRVLIPRTLLSGGLLALHWLTFYGSIKYSNVSLTLVCFSSTSLLTALLEPLFSGSSFSRQDILLGFLCLAGIYIIFHVTGKFRTGILLGMASAVLAALCTILNKSLTDRLSSENLSLYVLATGFAFLSLLMPAYLYWFPGQVLWPSGKDWLYLLFLSWFCTVLAFTLMIHGLKKVSPFTLNLSLNLEPVYGILLAFWLFGENRAFGAGFYAGMSLILLSVLIHTLRTLRERKPIPLPGVSG